MKKILSILFISIFTGCTLVEPGKVGIKVNLYGSSKGVTEKPLETGRVWYNPWSEDIYTFPTFMQNVIWTKDTEEGSPHDDSITFNSIEGAGINVDVALSFTLNKEKVPFIFEKHRMDIDHIASTYLRQHVRDSLNLTASKMKVVDIFGEGKEKLISNARLHLNTTLEPQGFIIDNFSFVSSFRVDERVESSINATIQATQKAIEAENKVKQSEAEAKQRVAEAKGKAESILLEAQAKADANRLLTQSLSVPLLQYESLQKWDGVMPRVTTNTTPLLSLFIDEKLYENTTPKTGVNWEDEDEGEE